ncbi:tektin-1 [Boleophthalmus pectinirostris]|uniref:tektin-1 n=1 Tax=Boleophthalmus pectinirostris TaxID=150288 RepID=UPI00242EBF55|nr:tektin-1 [Boleophthalmus pectinirostris]XP_055004083.1 tektin-1 [Boleophthalmus pectinirostris]
MSLKDYNTQYDAGVNLLNFKVIRDHSELFRAECMRLMEETNKTCKRMQDDDKKLLDQRVKDIHFLKKELEQKLEEIILETDSLITLQGRVQKALEACKDPLKVAVQCIDERMRRVPQERLHDAVDRGLLKEHKAIEEVVVLLQRVLQQLTEQIRLNRSSKYHLEQDLKEKFDAQSIDNSCILMTHHSSNPILESTNKTILPSLSVTPMQWENISDINLAKAEQQRNNSMSLRALVESLLEQTASDLQKHFQATTSAFQLNVQELKKAKGQMEDHLSKILLEYNKQQTICEELEVSIQENERCLTLAQARLSLRHKRPSKEQCFDPAQAQLLKEVQLITVHITKLREAVARSKEEQRALVRCQLELQENISNKSGALYIDEVLCTQHREPIVIHNF